MTTSAGLLSGSCASMRAKLFALSNSVFSFVFGIVFVASGRSSLCCRIAIDMIKFTQSIRKIKVTCDDVSCIVSVHFYDLSLLCVGTPDADAGARERHALSKQFLRIDVLRFSEDDIEIHYDSLDCRL